MSEGLQQLCSCLIDSDSSKLQDTMERMRREILMGKYFAYAYAACTSLTRVKHKDFFAAYEQQ